MLQDLQRPLTQADRETARLRPCTDVGKKRCDYASLGMTLFERRRERHRQAGDGNGECLDMLGFLGSDVVTVLSLGTLNVLAWVGRCLYDRAKRAPFHKPRTDGGVREDLLLRQLSVWRSKLTVDKAQRLRDGAAGDSQILDVVATATWTDEQICFYIEQNPDPRVRNSQPLAQEVKRLHEAVHAFNRMLVR